MNALPMSVEIIYLHMWLGITQVYPTPLYWLKTSMIILKMALILI